MPDCPDCGLTAKNKAGLASHRRAKHPAPEGGPVEAAVRADVDGKGTESLRATAVALAKALDETTSSRDVSSLARELRATLTEIGEGEEPTGDAVDELAARRAERLAASEG